MRRSFGEVEAGGEGAHEAAWAALPWLATERLAPPERARVAAHVACCADCRREIAAQRALAAVVAAQPALQGDLAGALARSRARRALAATTAPAGPAPSALAPAPTARFAPPRRDAALRLRGLWAVGAAALAASLAWFAPDPRSVAPAQPDAAFRTLTEAQPAAAGVVLRARASPDADPAALAALFVRLGLTVEAGPGAEALYTLRAADPAAAAAAAAALARAPGIALVGRAP